MTQKKITIELTKVETAHVVTALLRAQTEHEQTHGKKNPALTRAVAKLDAAASATPNKEVTGAEADPADD